MCDLKDFIEANQPVRRIHAFDEQSLSALSRDKVPVDIIEFLGQEGLSTYRDDFFWTTLPQDHFQTLTEWGLPGKQCFAFLKTAFGGLFFLKNDKIYRLDPFSGYLIESDFDLCTFLNLVLIMDLTLEACYFDIYQNHQNHRLNQPLQEGEVYGLVPALPLGGSFETSAIEVVKMHEYLAFLAQLFNNKVRKL